MIPWHEIYQTCAERFGWAPPVVAQLTLYALWIVLGAVPKASRVRVSPQEYHQMFGPQARRQLRQAGLL